MAAEPSPSSLPDRSPQELLFDLFCDLAPKKQAKHKDHFQFISEILSRRQTRPAWWQDPERREKARIAMRESWAARRETVLYKLEWRDADLMLFLDSFEDVALWTGYTAATARIYLYRNKMNWQIHDFCRIVENEDSITITKIDVDINQRGQAFEAMYDCLRRYHAYYWNRLAQRGPGAVPYPVCAWLRRAYGLPSPPPCTLHSSYVPLRPPSASCASCRTFYKEALAVPPLPPLEARKK